MSTVYIRFAARRPDTLQRSPLLERLVARAASSARVADWRAEAFRVIAPDATPMPPMATAALRAAFGEAPGAWVCFATPVHFSAGMSSVTMPGDGVMELSPEEADALAIDFNRTFAGAGVRLWVGRSAVLMCVFDRMLEATTHDPEAVAGHDVFGFQPAGRDAPRLRGLMSEMEMWLFDHSINRARTAHARRAVTGLWLWGGGPSGASIPTTRGWTAGHDPFFAAFGDATRFPHEAGPGVVVCSDHPGSSSWPDLEQRWLAPAAAALRSGRLRRLELSAGERCFSVGRGAKLRFWRRARPWWESFDTKDGEWE
ncbi:MAG TPA: hypothetical protein VNR70_07525 [Steroidobacteraceae bacterium]|nr:hypothetical protein [Steroidobacteraceae bacterium]